VGQYLLLKYPDRTITILLFPVQLLYGDLSLRAWFVLSALFLFWTHLHLECRKTSMSLNWFLKFYIDCSLGLNGGCSRWLQMQETRICKLRIFNSKWWERCIETNVIYVNCNKKLGRRRTFIAFLVMVFAVKLVHLLSISSCMKKIFYCISFGRSKCVLRPIRLL